MTVIREKQDPGKEWEDLENAVNRGEEQNARARGKQFMERYNRLNRQINQKLRFRDRLVELAGRTTGDPFAVFGGGRVDSRAAAVERTIDLNNEINRDVDRLHDLADEIWRVLSLMENQEIALILDDRYLRGSTAEQAAEHSGYSKRHVDRLTDWGLREVDRILREEKPMIGYVSPLE